NRDITAGYDARLCRRPRSRIRSAASTTGSSICSERARLGAFFASADAQRGSLASEFLGWLPPGVAGANTAGHALLDRIPSNERWLPAAAPAAATAGAQRTKPARKFREKVTGSGWCLCPWSIHQTP